MPRTIHYLGDKNAAQEAYSKGGKARDLGLDAECDDLPKEMKTAFYDGWYDQKHSEALDEVCGWDMRTQLYWQ